LLPQHPPVPVTKTGEVSLRILASPRPALSRFAGDYSEVFAGFDAARVFEALRPVIRNWAETTLLIIPTRLPKLVSNELSSAEKSQLEYAINLFMLEGRRGFDDLVNASIKSTIPTHWNTAQPVNHERAVYMLVTWALNLDYRQCRSRGLKLMVCLGHPPCIGLTKMELRDRMTSKDTQPRAQPDIGTTITISTRRPDSSLLSKHGELFLEAIKVANFPDVRYRLTGIWVPFGNKSTFQPGAIFEPGSQDGLLC
jgi:hypothetical protein